MAPSWFHLFVRKGRRRKRRICLSAEYRYTEFDRPQKLVVCTGGREMDEAEAKERASDLFLPLSVVEITVSEDGKGSPTDVV